MISLKSAYIDHQGYAQGTLSVNGIDITIREILPNGIIQQIEAFYITKYKEKMRHD